MAQSKLLIGITATHRYLHAIDILARRIQANVNLVNDCVECHVLLVTDNKATTAAAVARFKGALGNLPFASIELPLDDEAKTPYKESAQLMIAQMENAAFQYARDNAFDFFWSLEPDVLPQPNALRCMLDALRFDGGYYDVAMCTYPSQGGGAMLGGRGTARQWILPNIYPEERNLPAGTKVKWQDLIAKARECGPSGPPPALIKQLQELEQTFEQYPPTDPVMVLNGRGWRRRGWLDYAYPGIGKGAILPTDWVGMGCTLLSKKALAEAHFEGYQGLGTQDLFLCWHRWYPAGLRFCVITHSMCQHVVREFRKGERHNFDDLVVITPYHETEGECVGHIRMKIDPYYTFKAGEDVKPKIEPPKPAKKSKRK